MLLPFRFSLNTVLPATSEIVTMALPEGIASQVMLRTDDAGLGYILMPAAADDAGMPVALQLLITTSWLVVVLPHAFVTVYTKVSVPILSAWKTPGVGIVQLLFDTAHVPPLTVSVYVFVVPKHSALAPVIAPAVSGAAVAIVTTLL